MLSLLNPQQKQIFSQMQSQPMEQQAAAIAQMCNQNGITKEQFAEMINLINGNRN